MNSPGKSLFQVLIGQQIFFHCILFVHPQSHHDQKSVPPSCPSRQYSENKDSRHFATKGQIVFDIPDCQTPWSDIPLFNIPEYIETVRHSSYYLLFILPMRIGNPPPSCFQTILICSKSNIISFLSVSESTLFLLFTVSVIKSAHSLVIPA